jgi:hypothetical protein
MKDENDENFETVGPGKDFSCENSLPNIYTRISRSRAAPDSYSCCQEYSVSAAVTAPGTHPSGAGPFFRLGPANV